MTSPYDSWVDVLFCSVLLHYIDCIAVVIFGCKFRPDLGFVKNEDDGYNRSKEGESEQLDSWIFQYI